MKKIFYLFAAIGIAWGVVSCDNEPKNPGDFNVKSELTLGNVISKKTGTVYPLIVKETFDSIFGRNVTVYDTIWDENGEYLSRQPRDVWVPAKFTTTFVQYEPIMLPIEGDTFAIQIKTNAKWLSPPPIKPRGGSPFYNGDQASGGGDGTMFFWSEYNENATRKVSTLLNIYTSDSTVYHQVQLLQEGI